MAALQHRRLPLMLELLEALEHGEQAEVHRSHVEARHFRLPYRRRPYPLLDRHIGRPPRGKIDHDVRSLLDYAQERLECFRRLVRPAVLGIARVRSEEHTSELQSLMRISYAVFCLKQKNTHSINT